MNNTGKLFVISGPSGSGKSTIISEVLSRKGDLFFSISATTRKPRPGEEHGVNYFFVSREEFNKMIDDGDFFEYVKYVDNFYGTPKRPILKKLSGGFDVILDIEVQGAAAVRKNMPESVSIFIIPPKFSDLVSRLRKRSSDSEEAILNRIKKAREEYELAKGYDYIVINEDINTAANEVCAIITAEKCRAANRTGAADTSK